MFLILHAVKTLPAAQRSAADTGDDRKTTFSAGSSRSSRGSESCGRSESASTRAIAGSAHRARPRRHGRYAPPRNPTTRLRNSGRLEPLRHLAAQHPALGFGAAVLPLPVMTSTKVRPSMWARCRNSDSARWARVCVMPCRSSRASICLRPRESCERSRRPSGASGGALGPWLSRHPCGRKRFWRCDGFGGRRRLVAGEAACGFAARDFFRNGLVCFATLSHSACSSSLSSAFAPRRRRQFRNRGRALHRRRR